MKFLNLGSMKRNTASSTAEKSSPTTTARLYLRLFTRLAQFALGVAVIGLYATDLAAASRAHKYADSKWVFAVVVGTLSSLCAIALTHLRIGIFCVLDALVAFLFLVVFGIFGKMYISEDPEGNAGIIRMKRAVWVVLVALLLWLATAANGAVVFWRSRKARGSASVV